jgi:hypothetical protein
MFIGEGTLIIETDVVNFGDGVRIMKPSGVGGDGPNSFRKDSKTARVQRTIGTWRKNLHSARHGTIAQSLLPELL